MPSSLVSQPLVLPNVIIWDPLQQFPRVFGNQKAMTCLEHNCNHALKALWWQDGSKERYNPGSIHGMKGEVLIIAQILHCSNGHQITTCDARILLSTFSNKLCIPFILLHRCGFTWELSELIFALAMQGLSFSNIEAILSWHANYRTQLIFLSHWSLSEQLVSVPPSFLSAHFVL